MLKIKLALSATLAVLIIAHSSMPLEEKSKNITSTSIPPAGKCVNITSTFIPPAGKCKNITSLPIDYYALITVRHWQSVYIPDGKEFNKIVADYEDVFDSSNLTAIGGLHRFKMEDNTISSYVYTYWYGSDGYTLYEEVVGSEGQKLEFVIYTIGVIHELNAILYLRCLKNGCLDYDTRYVCMPRGGRLTAAFEQKLFEIDRTYNFTGGFRKL